MSIKTEAQILAEIQALIFDVWGNTPLTDPQAYVSDPLVQSQLPAAIGLSRLYERLEAWTAGLTPLTAVGDKLTYVAALMGQPRQTGLPSYVPVTFCIKDCACVTIESGTILLDHKGSEWTTLAEAKADSKGFAYVNAMSPEGAYDLYVGELRLETSIDNVKGTNSATPDIGGSAESDDALRRRLLNIRPHWRIENTPASIVSEIALLEGVVEARVVKTLPDCLDECGSQMVAVMGGDDDEIACAILKNLPISPDRLIGQSSGACECQTIKFQRMCPVKINVRYWTDCDCAKQTEDEITEAITEYINSALNKGTLTGVNLARCHKDVERIELKAEPMPFAPACYEAEEFTNPYTGETIRYATEDTSSYCFTGIDCADWDGCLDLLEWHYPIAGTITKMLECGCTATTGCGCL